MSLQYEIARPSGWDACCGGRRWEDFDPEQGDSLSTREVYDLLKSNQTGLAVVTWIHTFLLILWVLTSLVPGFCIYDGAAGSASAVGHIGWWMALQIFIIVVGSNAPYFTLHYTRDGVIVKGVDRSLTYLWFYQIVLILGIIALIVQDVLAWIEYGSCTSTLCTTQGGFLLTICIGLILLILMLAWTAAVLIPGYRRNLKYSLAFDKNDMVMMTVDHTRPNADNMRPSEKGRDFGNDTVVPIPSAPEGNGKGGVATPLLQQMRDENSVSRHGRKPRKGGRKNK